MSYNQDLFKNNENVSNLNMDWGSDFEQRIKEWSHVDYSRIDMEVSEYKNPWDCSIEFSFDSQNAVNNTLFANNCQEVFAKHQREFSVDFSPRTPSRETIATGSYTKLCEEIKYIDKCLAVNPENFDDFNDIDNRELSICSMSAYHSEENSDHASVEPLKGNKSIGLAPSNENFSRIIDSVHCTQKLSDTEQDEK